MIDIISYLIGLLKGKRTVVLEGDYVFTDPNHDGHIVVTRREE